MFGIGKLRKMFGLSAETIRVWERNGVIPPSKRTPGGHRRYRQEHIDAIAAILGPPINNTDEVVMS